MGGDVTLQGINRRLLLERRPDSRLSIDDVEIVEEPIGECGDGQVLVQRVWLTADATNGRSADGGNAPGPEVGEPIRSGGLGRVVESRHRDYEPGMWAGGIRDWEEWSLLDGDSPMLSRWPVGTDALLQLAVLNGPGPTAYIGLTDPGRLNEGDTALISDAAGETGSLAVQVARNLGASVIGIAPTEDGRRWVEELGAEACLDPASVDLDTELRELRPRGLDVVFDSAGGTTLDAALRRIAHGARVVIRAGDSDRSGPPVGPPHYVNLINRGATMTGLKTLDLVPRYPEAQKILREWHQAGELEYRVDVVDGLGYDCVDQINKAAAGTGVGMPLVKVCDDPGPGPY